MPTVPPGHLASDVSVKLDRHRRPLVVRLARCRYCGLGDEPDISESGTKYVEPRREFLR